MITRVGRQLELHLVEMENREELNGVVSRILDVRHLLRDAQERTARVVVQAARGGRGERPRSALVDDEVLYAQTV